MDRDTIGAIFNDLDQNERKLQIEQKVKESIERLEQQLSSNIDSQESKKNIEKQLEILKKIQMPQKLEEILSKEQDEIELELQSIISSLFEKNKLAEGLINRLNNLEQKSQTDLEFRKELMLHQLYSWVKENSSSYNTTPTPVYNGYSAVNEKPSFDKMLNGLLDSEIESSKNQENIQILKRTLEDGSIEVLPTQYVEIVVRKLIALNQITSEDRGCLRYYNQIINNKPLETIPRSPYQEFLQITDYVDLLPNELFNYSSNNSDFFRYGVAPGSNQYIKQINQIKDNLVTDYQALKTRYEELQNMLNSGNVGFYYEFFVKNLSMDDLYKVAIYVANLRKVENHTPSQKLSEEELKGIKENYTQEELQNICNVFAKNPGLFQIVEEKNSLDAMMNSLDDELSKKCGKFQFLFDYLYVGKNQNEFSEADLESIMYNYYQSKNGKEVNPDILQKAEKLKQKNPEMFEQILEKYSDSSFIQSYQDFITQKDELQVEQSKEVKGGLFNFGKAKAEEEKKNKIQQIEQKLNSAEQRLEQAKKQIRDSLSKELHTQYEEIKAVIPSAGVYCSIEGNPKEVDISELDSLLNGVESVLYTNISEHLVVNQREQIAQQQRENKGKYYNLCENKREVIRYIEQEKRPSMPIIQKLADGTYESDIIESDYLEQLKDTVIQQSTMQM